MKRVKLLFSVVAIFFIKERVRDSYVSSQIIPWMKLQILIQAAKEGLDKGSEAGYIQEAKVSVFSIYCYCDAKDHFAFIL